MEFSRLVFLLGAGASVSARVPDFAAIWRDFEQHFGFPWGFDHFPKGGTGKALQEVWTAIEAMRAENPEFNDFEQVCKYLHTQYSTRLDQLTPNQFEDQELLSSMRGLMRAEFAVRRRFVDLVDIDFNDLPNRQSLISDYKKMLDWSGSKGPIDVFTLNNDLLMEWLCMQWRASLADGFDAERRLDSPAWSCYSQPNTDVRLYKLHGSINWYRRELHLPIEKWPSQKSISGFLKRETAEIPVLKIPLIWPGIYEELEDIKIWRETYLATALAQARCVIIAGYKLGDVVLRNIVRQSLLTWPRPTERRVFIVCGEREYSPELKQLVSDMNCTGDVVVVETNADLSRYGHGYFPDILSLPHFRSQVDAALAAD